MSGKKFDYTLKLSKSFASFAVEADVYSNQRLLSLNAYLKYNLYNKGKRELYEILLNKCGNPTRPFFKSPIHNLWYADWDERNYSVSLILGDGYDPLGRGRISYFCSGNLQANSVAKDKKENGIIEVENKY